MGRPHQKSDIFKQRKMRKISFSADARIDVSVEQNFLLTKKAKKKPIVCECAHILCYYTILLPPRRYVLCVNVNDSWTKDKISFDILISRVYYQNIIACLVSLNALVEGCL